MVCLLCLSTSIVDRPSGWSRRDGSTVTGQAAGRAQQRTSPSRYGTVGLVACFLERYVRPVRSHPNELDKHSYVRVKLFFNIIHNNLINQDTVDDAN